MVGWPLLNGHEFERTLGDGEGQGSLAYYSPWGRKESDMTERLNVSNLHLQLKILIPRGRDAELATFWLHL